MKHRDFVFGVATASYQIEGSIHADGRLPSIWDTFCATPGKVLNGDSGARACEHYLRWADDVELIASLGVDAYRFSIAWPRVLNEQGQLNPKGLDFYRRLLDRLAERGLKSFVTLYHWDLPQYLEDRGGWLNRDTAYRFADYADQITRALSGRVTAWTTHNEPWCAAYLGYGNAHHAPGLNSIPAATQAMHHLLLGHGLALPAIRANDPTARVGLVANVSPAYAATDTQEDRRAATLYDAYQNGWVIDPLLRGEYPEELWQMWPDSAPRVQSEDMRIISTPMDYLGLNYYSRALVAADGDNAFRWVYDPDVERTQMDWEVYPQGLQDILEGLQRRYQNLPPIYITENGMASADKVVGNEVDDTQRLAYLNSHLAACSRAMCNGVAVHGYFVWSLMDNFEWAYGYERRFGIVHVDYTSQVRTLKRSGRAYARCLALRRLENTTPINQ